MSEKSRNMLVGATLILALALLMYGILILGKTPSWGALRPYIVTVNSPNANGVSIGSKVDLNGVDVGQVKSVILKQEANGSLHVQLTLQIDGAADLPASTYTSLGKQQLGASYVSLSASDASGPILPKDGTAVLTAVPGDSGLIPKDVRDNLSAVSSQLQKVAADLHTLLAYNTPESIDHADPKDPSRPVENISTLVIRLNRTIAGLQNLLTDPALQTQIRQIVQNLADASAQLKTSLASIDSTIKNADKTVTKVGDTATQATATLEVTQKQILVISEKLVDTLGQLEKSTKELTEGNGTTGKLVSDPRLYDGLVDLSKSMRSTVDDLDFLLKKWKDEGVNLKLK